MTTIYNKKTEAELRYIRRMANYSREQNQQILPTASSLAFKQEVENKVEYVMGRLQSIIENDQKITPFIETTELKKLVHFQVHDILKKKKSKIFFEKKQKYLNDFNVFSLKPLINVPPQIVVNGEKRVIISSQYQYKLLFLPHKAFISLFPNSNWDPDFFSLCNWCNMFLPKTFLEKQMPLVKNPALRGIFRLAQNAYAPSAKDLACFVFLQS